MPYLDNDKAISFLSRLKNKLHLNTIEDWDSLTRKKIRLHGGKYIYNNIH